MLPSDLRIRPAVEADTGEVLTVLRASFVTEAQLHDDPHMDPLTESLADLREVIVAGGVLVAVRDARIVGTIRARPKGALWHIARVAVVPDLQGQGIGSAMLAAVEAAAPAAFEEYEIATGPKSVRNVALYERHGYHRVSEGVPSDSILIHLRKKR